MKLERQDLNFWAKFFGKDYLFADAVAVLGLIVEMGYKLKGVK